MPREIRSLRVEGVILKHQDTGEADRMLTIYTRQKGKLRALAKGARKVRSRKSGHLEPFMHTSLQLATGRYWYVISQAEALHSYPNLRENLNLIGQASYIVELVDKFTYEEEENAAIYVNLIKALSRLDKGEDGYLVLRYFEIRMLDVLGFRPELQHCMVTGEEIKPEDQYFSAALGGVVSPEAGKGLPGAVPVSVRALKYMRHFQRSTYAEAQRASISPEIHRELEVLMQFYITYILERGMNTPAFMRRVRNNAVSQEDDEEE